MLRTQTEVMIHHDSVVAQGAVGCLENTGILSGLMNIVGMYVVLWKPVMAGHGVFSPGYPARIISYLPLSHIAGSLMDLLTLGPKLTETHTDRVATRDIWDPYVSLSFERGIPCNSLPFRS